EATANVDRGTDELIQSTLRRCAHDGQPAQWPGVAAPAATLLPTTVPQREVERGDDQSVTHRDASVTQRASPEGLGHGVRERTLSGLKAAGGAGRVLITIAHRIDTVMDADHLLVLSAGRLVEQGPPTALAAQSGGVFAGMVAAARHGGAHVFD
ncbi:hypothetical protein QJQ45_021685, partial [Haematococcus lacustris]